MPLGGSVVILLLRWRIEIGNLGWGLELRNRRKLGFGFFFITESIIDSSSGNQRTDRWQFARYTQKPS